MRFEFKFFLLVSFQSPMKITIEILTAFVAFPYAAHHILSNPRHQIVRDILTSMLH